MMSHTPRTDAKVAEVESLPPEFRAAGIALLCLTLERELGVQNRLRVQLSEDSRRHLDRVGEAERAKTEIVGALKRTECELGNMLDNRDDFSPEWVAIMEHWNKQVRNALSTSKWNEPPSIPCTPDGTILNYFVQESLPRGAWECSARKQSLPEPADCDWPLCGCDPHADKVIETLNESGLLVVPDDPADLMIEAGANALCCKSKVCARDCYEAMVERSQKP